MTVVFATQNKLRKDQADTVFRVTFKDDNDVVVDISSQTVLEIKFLHPDGTISTEAGALTTDGADGKAQFKDTGAAETNDVGTWKYWGNVTLGSDGPFPSSPLSYVVYAEGQG